MPFQLSYSKSVYSIYIVANTAMSLYEMMRADYFVKERLASLPADLLMKEFERRASMPVTNSNEIAEIYALFIALTFKEMRDVKEFFERHSNIKFEWFGDIAKYYLKNYTSVPNFIVLKELPKVTQDNINININVSNDDIKYINHQ